MPHASVTDAELTGRARLLAFAFLCISILAFTSSQMIYSPDLAQLHFWSRLQAGVGIATALALYALAPTRYARVGVYATLLVSVAMLAVLDPLSGTLGGGTWVLFQLCPPVAALVLRQPRATVTTAAFSAGALLLVALLQIQGVVPVRLTAERSVLYFNLTMQIVVMGGLAALIALITTRERRAIDQALRAQQESATQLQRVNELLAEQQRLNQELAESMAATHDRDAQIQHEQARQQELRRAVAQMSAPVVPILPGVVVVPLVGIFDASRLTDFSATLLAGIAEHRARIAVLDLTGVQSMDETIGQALVQAVASSRLLGTQVLVVGISPEGAQVLVSLGVDLDVLHPMANLQAAVQYAIRTLR